MNDVIIRPVITEKSMAQANKSKFTFIVSRDSNKLKIKKAVEDMFNVKVLDIVTTLIKGKTKRVGQRRTEKNVTALKKAVVKLEAGQKIDLFEISG